MFAETARFFTERLSREMETNGTHGFCRAPYGLVLGVREERARCLKPDDFSPKNPDEATTIFEQDSPSA